MLDAACRVFPARGYHQTSVDQVAAEAGLSIGAVYSNFSSKADLFLAVYELQVERWAGEVEARVGEGKTPAQRVRAAGRWWADFMRAEQEWLLLEIEFWAQAVRDPSLRGRFASLFTPLRQTTSELIQGGPAGEAPALSSAEEQLSTAVNALCTGVTLEKLLDPDGVPDEAFGRLLETLFGPFRSAAASRAPLPARDSSDT